MGKIINFANNNDMEFKAAQYCASKIDGNKKWYLPALGEFGDAYNKIDDINAALTTISPDATFSSYSTSTPRNKCEIRTYNFSNGSQSFVSKGKTIPVKCFAKI